VGVEFDLGEDLRIEAYERFFFEKLSMVPGIQEVNSIVALSEIKSTTSLPVLR
jgi:Lrp/AsnC family transcriptional regulator